MKKGDKRRKRRRKRKRKKEREKEVGVERKEVACKINKGCGRDSAGVVRETSCIVDKS